MSTTADPKSLDHDSSTWRRWIAPMLIRLAVLCAYHNACKGPFIFDDVPSISGNPAIRTLWPIWVPMFPAGNLAISGRPLVGLSLAINYAIGGLDPTGYHAANVLMHLASALVLYGITRRLLKKRGHASSEGIAQIVAQLWAVHPIHTEAITYVVNRSEAMLGLFSLLTFYTFLRSHDSRHERAWLALSIISSLAAVGCKEVGVMLGPIVLLLDVLLITGSWKQSLVQRRWYYAAFLLGWVLLVALLRTVASSAKLGGLGQISPVQYLAMQSQILLMYLKLCVWPAPLVVSYVDWPVPKSLVSVWPNLLVLGGLFIVTVIGVIRKHPAAAVGVVCFLILAPTSSFLPLPSEPAAERRMYLPLSALLLLLVVAIERISRMLPRRTAIVSVIVGICVIVLAQVSIHRNEDYSSTIAIWTDTIAKRPNNWFALGNMGAAVQPTQGWPAALGWYDASLRAKPDFARSHSNRGMCLLYLGRSDEGVAELQEGARLDPDRADAWSFLGWGLQLAGRPVEAEPYLRKALSINPKDPIALKRLPNPSPRLPTTPR